MCKTMTFNVSLDTKALFYITGICSQFQINEKVMFHFFANAKSVATFDDLYTVKLTLQCLVCHSEWCICTVPFPVRKGFVFLLEKCGCLN